RGEAALGILGELKPANDTGRIAQCGLDSMNSIERDGVLPCLPLELPARPSHLAARMLTYLASPDDPRYVGRAAGPYAQRSDFQLTFGLANTINMGVALLETAGQFRLSMTGPPEGCPSG